MKCKTCISGIEMKQNVMKAFIRILHEMSLRSASSQSMKKIRIHNFGNFHIWYFHSQCFRYYVDRRMNWSI